MPEFLLSVVPRGNLAPAVISGVTGAGKSFLADQLTGSKENLDTLAKSVNGKWLVDVGKIKHTDIVFGWCDNMGEVAKAMLEEWGDDTPLTLVWVRPSFEIWHEVITLKASEKGASHDPAHVKSREEMSNWTTSRFREWESAKLDLLVSKMKPDELIVVLNYSAKTPIKRGWHEFKPDMGSEQQHGLPEQKGGAND